MAGTSGIGDSFDAVIVGAGAAGAVFAATLAEAGRRVLVLEAGAPWRHRDLVSSQIWSRRLKWALAPVLAAGAHPINHNIGTGSGFGGAALHHYGTWPRFSIENFRIRSLFGVGVDWPIEYEDLRPWYDRVQREVGISGDAAAEIWRPPGEPYPMPPLSIRRHAATVARGFAARGMHTAPLPVAINSVPYRDRPACVYDGWCDAGCPIGALGNPLVTYVPRARRAGAEFRARCYVTRVLARGRDRVRGVEYYRNGKPASVEAQLVILAGSIMENVRLLFNSATPAHPAGLANSSGWVGKNLVAECAVQAFGLFPEEIDGFDGVSAGQLMYREGYRAARRPAASGGYQWQIGPAMKPNDIFGMALTRPEINGAALHRFLADSARHLGMMVAFGGGPAGPGNRIESATERDGFGMPLVRTHHVFPPAQLALAEHLHAEGRAIMVAAGAREAWTGATATGHLVGGAIMGSDPATSVTDSYGRSHDVRNLVLAGGCLFPCSGGTSPTFTIHAQSLRAAAHIAGHWSEYAA